MPDHRRKGNREPAMLMMMKFQMKKKKAMNENEIDTGNETNFKLNEFDLIVSLPHSARSVV